MATKRWLAAGAFLLLVGCTSGERASIRALGHQAHVKCWSGGVLIYDGYSVGIVENESNSDGYYFEDRKDRHAKSVSGNCVVEYNVDEP